MAGVTRASFFLTGLILLCVCGGACRALAAEALQSDEADLLAEEAWLDEAMLDAIEQDVLALLPGRNVVRLGASGDNAGNTQWSAGLQLQATDSLLLDASLSQSAINDSVPAYSTTAYRAGVGSAAYDGFIWYAAFSAWGKRNSIETEDSLLELRYRALHWWGALQLSRGDVVLFIDPVFSNRLRSISSGREAAGISLGRDTAEDRWWLSWLHRDYERNVALLNNSLVLQRILQSVALDQAYALSRDEYSLGWQWFWRHSDTRLEFSRVVSAVDAAESDYVSLNQRFSLDDTLSLSIGLQTAVGSGLNTLSAALALSW